MNFVDKDGTTKVYIPVHPWKNNVLFCSKFYGYPHHQNRLGHMLKPPNESCETSVFFGTSSKSREEIEKFQRE